MILNELKLNTTETPTPYCNFITPPSQPTEDLPSVLLIDLSWSEVEDIVHWYKTGDTTTCYNIYLYQDVLWDHEWFGEVLGKADTIIVNTDESAIMDVKMKFIADPRTWYYGPKKFKGSNRSLERPLDWFIKHGR